MSIISNIIKMDVIPLYSTTNISILWNCDLIQLNDLGNENYHITTILMDDIQLTFIIRLQMQQEPEEVVDVEEVIGLEKTKAQFQILTHLAIFMVIVTYEADLT